MSDDDQVPDSMRMFEAAGVPLRCYVTDHLYVVCLLFVMLSHWWELWKSTDCLTGREHTRLAKPDAPDKGWCNDSLRAMMAVGDFFPMEAFFVVAGCIDVRLPPALMRKLAVNTAFAIGVYLWIFFYSDVPETLSAAFDVNPAGRYFHRELAWYALCLLIFRTLHAAFAVLNLRFLLMPLGIVLHFGCWAGNCPWPFNRDPFDMRLVAYDDPMRRVTPLLPRTGQNSILLLYYVSLPFFLPRGFPRSLPDPFAALLRLLPTGPLQRWLLAKSQVAARWLWVIVLLSLWVNGMSPSSRSIMKRIARSQKFAYGCTAIQVFNCHDQRWSVKVFAHDVLATLLVTVTIVGVASAMPRRKTPFSWLGSKSFQVYVLHDYLMSRVGPPSFRVVLHASQVLHSELMPMVVLGVAAAQITLFAMVPYSRMPPLWAPWVSLAADKLSPRTRQGSHPWRSLAPLPIFLFVLHLAGGLRIGRQLVPIIKYAVGLDGHCAELRQMIPEGIFDVHRGCRMSHDAWDWAYYERPCSALRLCSEDAIRRTDHPERCVEALFKRISGGGKEFEAGAQHCAERALWYQLDGYQRHVEPYSNAIYRVAKDYPRRCGALAHTSCLYPYAAYVAGHLKPPVTRRVTNVTVVPIDPATAKNCTTAWRDIAGGVPCRERYHSLLATYPVIGSEGALRRVASEYRGHCKDIARVECASVLGWKK